MSVSRHRQNATSAFHHREFGWDFLPTIAHLLGELGFRRACRDDRQVYKQILIAVYLRNGSSGDVSKQTQHEQNDRLLNLFRHCQYRST